MNAIKLPVVAYRNASGLWNVRNENNIRIGLYLTEAQANQMCVALNCHDTLVDALKNYCHGNSHGDIARAALAKVEDLRKKV